MGRPKKQPSTEVRGRILISISDAATEIKNAGKMTLQDIMSAVENITVNVIYEEGGTKAVRALIMEILKRIVEEDIESE